MQPHTGGGRLLRLTELAEPTPGQYRVEIALEGAGPRLTATSTFILPLTDQDRADLRWYLEDFLLFPLDPAPQIAARIEERMAALGEALCRGVFFGNRDATRLWDRAREELRDTRVEVITDVRHAASVPWELIRDPDTKTPLALEAQAFVRSHTMPTKVPKGAATIGAGPIRILLVICRPGGDTDVPFRSVASRLLKGLDAASRELVQLDVLRPPTFPELARVLRAAKAKGKPYHVVHFDGHGVYLDEQEKKKVGDVLAGVNAHVLGGARKGAHGYLVFEHPDETVKDNGQLIDGPDLGALLVETGVPVLVLNACRSAHADPPEQPENAGEGSEDRDLHSEVASFGSLALEVMDKGVSGVVAMRYNVYVVTAAQFVADLYAALGEGLALGEAVTQGRKQLHASPDREIAFAPRPLQDWCVPVVYEAEPIPLFPAPASGRKITLTLGNDASKDRAVLHGVPARPDVGFFGRDETLLALDRAFDRHRVVLMHAYAGSGKTSTAAEFARWYAETGGVEGPVVWTSFERRMPLSQVLDQLGRVFEKALEQNGLQWLALSDAERRQVALRILKQVPVLWVWDNVEPVAGFPEGTASAWTVEERGELVEFLREARETQAKFLLTSRRDERRWLGDLPARVKVPAMPMQERVQLARALASKRGVRLEEVADWKPLLAFTQGNPLTITVLVGQALRDGLRSKEQIAGFVAKLRTGEKAFEDDEREGRTRSLGASLSYGFEHAFGEEDKKRLALLHLFQGFVDVDSLVMLGNPKADGGLPEVHGLTREAGSALLDRAAEVGMLSAHGEGYYSIHPAAPWFLARMFDEQYPTMSHVKGASCATDAVRVYVAVVANVGNAYHNRYSRGLRDHLSVFGAEESNLLHAWRLACSHGWWFSAIGAMQGLRKLYEHTGRNAEWARLVTSATPYFVDPATEAPLPGREREWGVIIGYRVRLAQQARNWSEAEKLQQIRLAQARQDAAEVLVLPADVLSADQRNEIRTLAVSIETLGHIRLQVDNAECVPAYLEAFALFGRIGASVEQAGVASNIGNAYMIVPALRDLAATEQWYRRALSMFEEQRDNRAQCLCQLGIVSHERYKEACAVGSPDDELFKHLDAALLSLHEALVLLSAGSVDVLAVINTNLGSVYGDAGDIERALYHYQHALRHDEKQGNFYAAAQTRFNAAIRLANAGRLVDARAYAFAALRNFETYGDRAATDILQTNRFLADVNRALAFGTHS